VCVVRVVVTKCLVAESTLANNTKHSITTHTSTNTSSGSGESASMKWSRANFHCLCWCRDTHSSFIRIKTRSGVGLAFRKLSSSGLGQSSTAENGNPVSQTYSRQDVVDTHSYRQQWILLASRRCPGAKQEAPACAGMASGCG